MANHLSFQACSTQRRIRGVSLRAFAFANCLKNAKASDDHPPPTLLAMTTKRQRLHEAANSGYVCSLRRLAAANATPSQLAAPPEALPSQCNADTNVVSTAISAPPNNGKPSATTSSLRPPLASGTQIQIMNEDVRRDACTLPHGTLLPQRFRGQSLSSQEPQLWHMMRGDGQKSRVDGHTGKSAEQGGGGDASASTTAPGTTGAQSAGGDHMGPWTTQPLRHFHSATSRAPSLFSAQPIVSAS